MEEYKNEHKTGSHIRFKHRQKNLCYYNFRDLSLLLSERSGRFFLAHHSEDNIMKDIERNRVFLCLDGSRNAVGTVTIKKNEISRLFVLPSYQGMGYGTEMLDFAE